MATHLPKHRFDPGKALNLLDRGRRLIDDPMPILRDLGVGAGMTVVDMGCGPGFFEPALLELVGPLGWVVAVDLEPSMGALMVQHVGPEPRLRFVVGSVEQAPLPYHCCDAVLFAFTLHEVAAISALAEARRLLRPQGILLVLEWGEGVCPPRPDGIAAGPPMDHRLTAPLLRQILSEQGFEVNRCTERLNGCQYLLAAR